MNFNSRSPFGERLSFMVVFISSMNFNSRSLLGERSPFFSTLRGVPSISILAPCVGSDLTDPSLIVPNHDFNSRPCVRSDGCYFKKFFFLRIFNSRSLCGERSVLGFLTGLTAIISILAPCMGSDICSCTVLIAFDNFNSRSFCGERPIKQLV